MSPLKALALVLWLSIPVIGLALKDENGQELRAGQEVIFKESVFGIEAGAIGRIYIVDAARGKYSVFADGMSVSFEKSEVAEFLVVNLWDVANTPTPTPSPSPTPRPK